MPPPGKEVGEAGSDVCRVAQQEDRKRNIKCVDIAHADEPPKKKVRVQSTPAQKTLRSFISDSASSSAHNQDFTSSWKEVDTLIVFQYGSPVSSTKVASFDLDNTIIETASGKKFPTGPSDWKLMPRVSEKLKSLIQEGYKVIFLSNQLGIAKGKPTKPDFKLKMQAIAAKLSIPLLVLASTAKDMYRKPCTGMWEHLDNLENGTEEVDMKSSYYVGDAAGRVDKWMPG